MRHPFKDYFLYTIFTQNKIKKLEASIIDKIKVKARTYFQSVKEIRRHLHMHPELSFSEKETARFIVQKLDEIGVPYTENVGGFGVVAYIHGKNTACIALRADMDALPIQETNEVVYKSTHDGIMHACGHDVHTACLLGAVMILNDLKDHLPYSLRIIFQPGEEKLPGGASIMIQEGVLKDPEPMYILGQHVFPSLEVGKVGLRSGLYMASADEIYIEVIGKGGHGATPHEVNDVILAASQMIVSLQQVVSRRSNPAIPTVLSFGKIYSDGGATNIIPDKVYIEGTFRTMDEKWRFEAHDMIEKIAQTSCHTFGVNCNIRIVKGYPFLINEPQLTSKIKSSMQSYLGNENVIDLPIRMTSEDFAFYSQVIPACFYRLGTGNKQKGITASVHTPTFDIDENALEVGMGLMAWLAINASDHKL